jgi:hypothetical protein
MSLRDYDVGYFLGVLFYFTVSVIMNESCLNCLVPSSLYSVKNNFFIFNTTSIHHFAEIISSLRINDPSLALRIGFLSPAKELLSSSLNDFNYVFDNIESYSLEIVLKKVLNK